jgi:hypothetical protein
VLARISGLGFDCEKAMPICEPRLGVQRAFRHGDAEPHIVPVLVRERFSRLRGSATLWQGPQAMSSSGVEAEDSVVKYPSLWGVV